MHLDPPVEKPEPDDTECRDDGPAVDQADQYTGGDEPPYEEV